MKGLLCLDQFDNAMNTCIDDSISLNMYASLVKDKDFALHQIFKKETNKLEGTILA